MDCGVSSAVAIPVLMFHGDVFPCDHLPHTLSGNALFYSGGVSTISDALCSVWVSLTQCPLNLSASSITGVSTSTSG